VYDTGRWHEVLPCPLPDTIPKMSAAKEENAKREGRAEQLRPNCPFLCGRSSWTC